MYGSLNVKQHLVFTLHPSTVQAYILAILVIWDSSVTTVRSSQSHYEHYSCMELHVHSSVFFPPIPWFL